MFRSLRFRLPAFFLAGVVVAGLVATALAVKLFQDYTRDRTYSVLRRESLGLARLYGERAGQPAFSSRHLEEATGDRLCYVQFARLDLFPGQRPRICQLPPSVVDVPALQRRGVLEFEYTGPRSGQRYLAVARTVEVGGKQFGALVVASPKSALRTRWLTLIERLAIAFAAGIVVAALLGFYLSRRITKPVLALVVSYVLPILLLPVALYLMRLRA